MRKGDDGREDEFQMVLFPQERKKTKVSIVDDDDVRTFLDEIGNKQ